MILTGSEIEKKVRSGSILISPFSEKQINPNSYDFRLGDTLKVYTHKILDTKKHNSVRTIKIPKKGIVLEPDKLYLGHTVEVMGSKEYVPVIRGKSSIGRLGLFIHITADLIDVGSINQWTLMFHAVQRIRIYPNMLIGQVTFWKVQGKIMQYKGKYQGSMGPMESHIFKDFED